MICYDEGQLQAYLDGEVSFQERRDFETHLQACDLCRANLVLLEKNRDLTNNCLKVLAEEAAELKVNPGATWSRFYLSGLAGSMSRAGREGGLRLSGRLKKWALAAAVVLGIGLAFTNSTVRAVASDFLTLFRVEKIQTVAIDPQQLQDLARVFREKGISLEIENFGQVTNHGVEPPQEVSIQEAVRLAGFELRLPGYLPFQASRSRAMFWKSGTVEFQLNVRNVNNLLKTLGGTVLLPDELDGRKFVLQTPNSVSLNYWREFPGDPGNRPEHLTISQFRSPVITAPAGTDADRLRKAFLSLPAVPEDIRRQLASIEDWQKTLVIPTVNSQTQQVRVGNQEAIYMVPQSAHDRSDYGILTWQAGEIINVIEGNLTKDELIKVATNLK